jgi:hypothetical protein
MCRFESISAQANSATTVALTVGVEQSKHTLCWWSWPLLWHSQLTAQDLWARVLACNRHAQFCCPIPQYLRALRDPSGLPTWLPVALSPDTWASMSNSMTNELEVCMYPGEPQAKALMLLADIGGAAAL